MTMNGNQGFGGTNQGHEPTPEELKAAKKGAEVEAGDAQPIEETQPTETQETAPETTEPAAPTQPAPTEPAQPSAPAEQPSAPATDQVAPATEPTQETAPAAPTDEVEVTQEHLDQYPELIEKGIELGQKVLKSVLDELEALKKDLSNSQPQG